MLRRISHFRTDEIGAWIADLDCGHSRHVRHEPPLSERPWVSRESDRSARLGTQLDCGLCDRREVPKGFCEYRRTRSFDAESTPDALRKRHSTKAGVWGLIRVETGRLALRTFEPFDDEAILTPGTPGVVLPEVEHALSPLGPVRFRVEFLRGPETGG